MQAPKVYLLQPFHPALGGGESCMQLEHVDVLRRILPLPTAYGPPAPKAHGQTHPKTTVVDCMMLKQ